MDTRLTPRLLGVTLVAALVFVAAIVAIAVLAARPATATAAPPAAATSTAPIPGVTVSGRAQVEGVPDTLRLDMGVNVVEDDVETALAKANEATAKLHKTLRDNGVAERDLASTGLSIQPQLDWRSNSPTVTGYQVSQTVTARLRDTDRAGAVINAAANSTGNTTIINSIAWDLEDNTALLADARDRAIADARTKAEQYARAAGRSLGAVVSITESTTAPPQPYAYGAAEAQDSAAGAVPLAPGTQAVAVEVQVVYAFD
ncbi:DUF541 domain-containing protein [Nostocoides sp. F2B08]|uniref:SIMPL domain-containing protein n=1 Tax=Nostocoides sp. F2B08 TaxID=2653936 RepID=UPI001263CB79|nr:SIMPL domain-containing protein [Tetrasphaera sp. F2B08]KAB7744464.1 DUF541 domain-containing protein [Tetrasphaera sp. F2B08]